MNFFEIIFLSLVSIYGILLIGFLAIFVYDTIMENKINNMIIENKEDKSEGEKIMKYVGDKIIEKELKKFVFEIESYLAYHNDEDTLTKKEILIMLGEILKENYNIETKKI